MNKNLHNPSVDQLFDAILTLTSREECYRFFEDVCTVGEILSVAQRLEVANMLRDGSTYTEIASATGASTATISRVGRSMNYGNGSYDLVFERLKG